VKVAHLPLKIAGLLVFMAVCLAMFYELFIQAGGHVFQGPTYNVSAVVPNAYNLVTNGDVREAGVKIGYITGITNQGPYGKVTMAIERQYAPLYRDAQVQVRLKTLVGEDYMSIQYPGSPQAGVIRDGGTLPLHDALTTVDLYQILNTFDPHTRAMVSADLRALGSAFDNRGADLNQLFGALAPLASSGAPVMQTLDAQRGQLAQLIQYTGQAMQAFANRTSQLQGLIGAAKSTAVAVAARDRALSQAIDELPATLSQARATVANLGSFSAQATPVIDNLDTGARLLGPVVRQLAPTASAATRLFARLPALIRSVNPLVAQLRTFSATAKPQVPLLADFLNRVNPAIAYLAPYNREIGSFFANTGSATQPTDNVGHLGRVGAVVNIATLDEFTPAERKLLDALIQAGDLGAVFNANSNAYPAPGSVDNPQPFSGSYPRLSPTPAH
jgi:phospholipid/cholesterol/gamma-HCH transport system substrate-binding protein